MSAVPICSTAGYAVSTVCPRTVRDGGEMKAPSQVLKTTHVDALTYKSTGNSEIVTMH